MSVLMGKLILFHGCVVFMAVHYFQHFGSKVTFLFCLLGSFCKKSSLFHVQPPTAFKSHSTVPFTQKNMDIHLHSPKMSLWSNSKVNSKANKDFRQKFCRQINSCQSCRRVGYFNLRHRSCSCIAWNRMAWP